MAGEITKSTNIKTLPMGTVVIQEGASSPKEMILLLQGNIGVYKNYRMTTEEQIKVIGQGSFYSEMSLFLNQEQGETLVALTEVVVLSIDRRNVKSFFVNQPDMAFTIVESICKKLDEASSELRKLRPAKDLPAPSRRSTLFPDGHGNYTLPLVNDSEILYTAKTTCPLCGHTFDSLGIIYSKLKLKQTDPDLRVWYKDFEPLYYEIITCPNCFFSALSSSFDTVSRQFASDVNQAVGPYKLEMYIKTGMERDSFTVFAGYYLALLSAPVVFDEYQLTTANLWLKLSRIYHDCNEQALYLHAVDNALINYRYSYENLNIPDNKTQQICYIIGDLYSKKGDIDAAQKFFFFAKMDKKGSPVMTRQTDLRLEEIREIMKSRPK